FGYRLALPRLDPSGWGPEGNAGWGPELLQMGDWYPALVPYQDGAGWQSWEYWPVGDPVVSLPGDYDVRIRTAADVVVAAPGYAGEADGERQYRLDGARSFAFLASPNYVRFDGTAGGVPVAVYVTRAYAAVGPVVLETAVGALQLFGELYGPYPYGEFVMAQNGFLTAMEYSALVSLSGFAFDSYADTPDSLLVAIIAHEVAHQWWYGAVGNDQVSEPWLDESLAMISELLYYERFHPELTAWWWQFRVDRWEPAGAVDVSIYDFGSSERFVHNMYGQAAHFMADLRQAMGAAAFGSFLRDYYQQYAGELATGADFLGLAQAYTAVDLGPVRDAYFR
ncbi:MAG: hypothetical protein KC425_22105, partial [Anaerolineales bacterium]|nr:hypothetical protein [Anaerolineales bacterium]